MLTEPRIHSATAPQSLAKTLQRCLAFAVARDVGNQPLDIRAVFQP